MKSRILVFIQFLAIFLMILPLGGEVQNLYSGLVIISAGIIIGLFAIKAHSPGNFNIRPDIKEECVLVSHSIYKYIRHPMYLSVLLSMLGVLVLYANIYVSILYVILLANMLTKMFYEEFLWHSKDENYKEYAQNTYRLIPYIF
ncbi:MAG: isoprenylcysteine carboxylmethyltransferase family protein [Thiovulaceae bacterium]|nr:isoprenylcysteine carboxylmethyltransferase family protein [Sulfurimonadaceae bacterium]